MEYYRGRIRKANSLIHSKLLAILMIVFMISLCIPIKTIANETTNRLAGSSRYDTTAEIAKRGWPNGISNAILAYGENFPDALAAVPLSTKLDAPILLTNRDDIPSVTKESLQTLHVKNVILIGGKGVVSPAIEEQLVEMGITYTRLEGLDRYDTSVKIANYLNSSSNKLIVTTGDDFPNALSISSYAGIKGIPVVLVEKDHLSDALKQYLNTHVVMKTYIVAGSSAISDTVMNLFPNPQRIQGADRYETNINILKTFDVDYNSTHLYFANGQDFADALAGSALAAKESAPVVLLNNDVVSSTVNYLMTKNQKTKEFIILGGEGAIASTLFQKYFDTRDKLQNLKITSIDSLIPIENLSSNNPVDGLTSFTWTMYPDQHNVSRDKIWNIVFSSDFDKSMLKQISITKNGKFIPGKYWWKGNALSLKSLSPYESDSVYKLQIVLRNGQGYYLYFDTFSGGEGILKYQLRSTHFVFYSTDTDKNVLQGLADALEVNYKRVNDDLRANVEGTFRVEIYPDEDSFLTANGYKGYMNWVIADATQSGLQMISPNNPGPLHKRDTSFTKHVVHEFTHDVEFALNRGAKIPTWLNEGVASWEAQEHNQYIDYFINQEGIPTLKELDNTLPKWGYNGGYQFSYTVVEYFLNTYGYDKLSALIKNPENFEVITGISLSKFQEDWVQAIKMKYR